MTRLMTADDLAERWRVPKSWIYAAARDGRIPCVELGRYRRFAPDAIEQFEKSFTNNINTEEEAA